MVEKGSNGEEVALGFQLIEVVLCLISFSIMAADKTQGWSGDSFDHYKEFRFSSFSFFFQIFFFISLLDSKLTIFIFSNFIVRIFEIAIGKKLSYQS